MRHGMEHRVPKIMYKMNKNKIKTKSFLKNNNPKTELVFTDLTYSGELRFKPRVVRSIPGANATRLWSFSAARMNVNKPTMPN